MIDNAVKRYSLVKTRINKLNEVIAMDRRTVVKFDFDVSEGGFHKHCSILIAAGRIATNSKQYRQDQSALE